jgi:hypothetical protein
VLAAQACDDLVWSEALSGCWASPMAKDALACTGRERSCDARCTWFNGPWSWAAACVSRISCRQKQIRPCMTWLLRSRQICVSPRVVNGCGMCTGPHFPPLKTTLVGGARGVRSRHGRVAGVIDCMFLCQQLKGSPQRVSTVTVTCRQACKVSASHTAVPASHMWEWW